MGALPSGLKRLVRDDGHASPPNGAVKNGLGYTSTPPYTFNECRGTTLHYASNMTSNHLKSVLGKTVTVSAKNLTTNLSPAMSSNYSLLLYNGLKSFTVSTCSNLCLKPHLKQCSSRAPEIEPNYDKAEI